QVPVADDLLANFRRFHPDSTWVRQLQLIVDCAHGRVDSAAWGRWARDYPAEVATASRSLALLARRYDCAEHGFRAVLGAGELTNQVRWMAALGLQSLLIAKGRDHDALNVLDTVVAKGLRQAMAIYIVDAAAGFGGDNRAEEAMKLVAGRYDQMS